VVALRRFLPPAAAVRALMANARRRKNVCGRKADIDDAMGVTGLMSFALVKASLVPAQKMQELRSPPRTRKQLTREQTRHVPRKKLKRPR
jgi:transposase